MSDSEERDEELPWTEAQWEALMKRSDVRSARYGELLETLIDHPDRDEIIDREMGWDRADEEPNEEVKKHIEELNRICEEGLDDPDIEREMEERERQLESMPAYRKSFDFAVETHKKLKHLFVEDEEEAEEPDEDLVDFVGSTHLVGAKLAGGHGMGYDDDSLCGNIVNCKRALKAAKESVQSLEALRGRNVISPELFQEFMTGAQEVRRLVEEHIENLRERVWWE